MPKNNKPNKVLGKGLDSLMNTDSIEIIQDIQHPKKSELPLDMIIPNPDQPRKNFPEDALETLMESIENHGLVQPIVVRKVADKYQIVAGERRYRAFKGLGKKSIPVIIKDYSTEEVTEIALVENLQRQDLDPIEEAFAYQRLMDTFKQTQEKIAARLGRSRSHVANMMRLLNLPEAIRNDLSVGELSIGQARPLLGLHSEKLQLEAAEKIKEGDLSARQVEGLVKSLIEPKKVKPKKNNQDSAELRAMIEKLKLSLGAPVAIKLKNSKKIQGKIEIAFSSEKELERLLSYMEDGEESKNKELAFNV